MKREMKIDNYKRIYNELQNDSDVHELGYPENKENLDFYGEIGKFKFDYSLMFEKDLLKIRAERNCPGTSDDVLFRFARQMGEEGENISPTAYDEKIILSTFYPFPGIETDVASEHIYQTAKKFFEFLKYAEEKAKKFDSNIPKTEKVKTKNDESQGKNISEKSDPIDAKTVFFENVTTNELMKKEPVYEGKQTKDKQNIPVSDQINESSIDLDTTVSQSEDIVDVIIDLDSDAPATKYTKKEKKKYSKPENHKNDRKKQIKEEFPTLPYKPAPEIERQMEDMYAALNKTMQMKKEQLDLREDILNKKDAGIEKEQKRLVKERETLIEEKRLLDNEREDLNKSWDLYHESTELLQKEKNTVDSDANEIREKEKSLRRREQSLNDKARNLDSKITSTNKKAENLAELEKELHSREEDVTERNKSILNREHQLELKQKHINFLMEQINVEKETIESKTADLKNLEKMLKEMEKTVIPVDEVRYQEEINSLNLQMDEIREQLKDRENTIALYKDEIRSLKNEQLTLNKENEELKYKVNHVEDLESKLKQASEEIQTLQKEPKIETQELAQLRDELAQVKESKEEYKKASEERDAECESLKKERNELKEKLDKYEKESNPDAETLISQLQSEGIRMELVAGEIHGLITGEIEGCKVIVDTEQGVVCVQKNCKRNHVRDLVKWTSENISECFYQAQGIVYGRKYSSNIQDIKALVSRISLLK